MHLKSIEQDWATEGSVTVQIPRSQRDGFQFRMNVREAFYQTNMHRTAVSFCGRVTKFGENIIRKLLGGGGADINIIFCELCIGKKDLSYISRSGMQG